MRILFFFIVFYVFSVHALCEENAQDSIFIESMLSKEMDGAQKCPPLFFARRFVGMPYVGGTLDRAEEETLVINTRELDCVTFVENVVALTVCARNDEKMVWQFRKAIEKVRYRDGRMAGFGSRLHYFSEWIDDNVKKGIVREVPASLHPAAKTMNPEINFMSSNTHRYKALQAAINDFFSNTKPNDLQKIKEVEKRLSRTPVTFIPKNGVDDTASMRKIVEDGDIIAILTSIRGLDISHVGVATWKADGLHMLHASSTQGRVVEERLLLADYLRRNRSSIGIRVIRINY